MKYEPLRELVYKILYPQGIPLEFGCEVESDTWKRRGVILKVNKYQRESDTYDVYWEGFNEMEPIMERSPRGFWKILGKPLSIADILRALEEKNPGYAFTTTGDLIKWNGDCAPDADVEDMHTKINLALPLSAPENSSACEELIKLLK